LRLAAPENLPKARNPSEIREKRAPAEHSAALTICVDLRRLAHAAVRAPGDSDPSVLAEAFLGLLALSPDDAAPFVAERLAARDIDVARAAAMAFGEIRRREAVAALRARLPAEDRPDVRHAIILALAASRDGDAFDVLLELVARGAAADAKAAVEALRLFPHDEALQGRVQAALHRRQLADPGRPQRPPRAGGRSGGPRS
jgi:HEAT repeat protein